MKQILLFSLLSAIAMATPPVIVDGPRIVNLQRTGALIKYRTSDALGATSTLGANITSSTPSFIIGSGDCPKFPLNAVVSINGEHMLSGGCVVLGGNDTLFVNRNFDLDYMSVFSQQVTSVTVAGGGFCTVVTSVPHFYVGGVFVAITGQALISGTPTAITIDSATQFHMSCPGSTNGTYNNNALVIAKAAFAHSIGATIIRVDSDTNMCFGPTTAYGFSAQQPPGGPQQSVNHYAYLTGQLAGAVVHAKVQATPRSLGGSNCPSPGSDTVESADQVITLPTLPTSATPTLPANAQWNHSDALTYLTDLTASSFADLQTKINNARGMGSDGNLNYRVKVPAGSFWAGNVVIPPKTGVNPLGTGRLVLETGDFASMPAQGALQCKPFVTAACIDLASYASHMATIYTQSATPTLQFGAGATYVITRGIIWGADPTRASAFFGGDFPLITSFGGLGDNDPTLNPDHIAIDQSAWPCPTYNRFCKGLRIHGTFISLTGNFGGPNYGVNADQGCIQVDGLASAMAFVDNNICEGSMTGYYQSDNGLNTSQVTVTRNWFFKPWSWGDWSLDYHLTNATQAATLTAGNPTLVTTTNENDATTAKPVSFTGLAGSWAVMNRRTYSLTGYLEDGVTATTGTVTSVVANGSTATWIIPSHGFTTGDLVVFGGGHIFPCGGFATGDGAPVSVTVINANSFTTPTSLTFGTSTNQCVGSNLAIAGPVFQSTSTGASTFTLTKNSTGFTGTNTSTLAYPEHHIIKNGMENKNCNICLYEGNVVQNAFSQDQHGQLFALTTRGPGSQNGWPPAQGAPSVYAAQVIQDVTIRNNIWINGCTGLSILGSDPISPTAMMQRVLIQNNLELDVSGTATGGGNCNQYPIEMGGAYSQFVVKNMTMQSQGKFVFEDYTSSFPVSGSFSIANSIVNASQMASNSFCGGIGMIQGGAVPCAQYSWAVGSYSKNVLYGCAFCIGSSDPWGFQKAYFYGFYAGSTLDYQNEMWPSSQTGVGFAGLMPITGCTNATPIVCNMVNTLVVGKDVVFVQDVGGNTNANGLAWACPGTDATHVALCGTVGNGAYTSGGTATCWLGPCATLASAALGLTSPYLTGVPFIAPVGAPNYNTAGQGPGDDGQTIGANMAAIQAAVNGAVLPSTIFRNVRIRGPLAIK